MPPADTQGPRETEPWGLAMGRSGRRGSAWLGRSGWAQGGSHVGPALPRRVPGSAAETTGQSELDPVKLRKEQSPLL